MGASQRYTKKALRLWDWQELREYAKEVEKAIAYEKRTLRAIREVLKEGYGK